MGVLPVQLTIEKRRRQIQTSKLRMALDREAEELRQLLSERDADADVMLDRLDDLEAQLAERDDELRETRMRHATLESENGRLNEVLGETERSFLAEFGTLRRLVLTMHQAAAATPSAAIAQAAIGSADAARELRTELAAVRAERDALTARLPTAKPLGTVDEDPPTDPVEAARLETAERAIVVLREHERHAVARALAAEAETRTLADALAAADAEASAAIAEAQGRAEVAEAARQSEVLSQLGEAYALLSEDRRLLALELDELRHVLEAESADAERKLEHALERAEEAERLAERVRVRAARGEEMRRSSAATPWATSPTRSVDGRAGGTRAGGDLQLGARAMSPRVHVGSLLGGGHSGSFETGLRVQSQWRAERRAAGHASDESITGAIVGAEAAAGAARSWKDGRAHEPVASGHWEEQAGVARTSAHAARAAERGGLAFEPKASPSSRTFSSPERKRWQAEVSARMVFCARARPRAPALAPRALSPAAVLF
jgi:hypothetical protein